MGRIGWVGLAWACTRSYRSCCLLCGPRVFFSVGRERGLCVLVAVASPLSMYGDTWLPINEKKTSADSSSYYVIATSPFPFFIFNLSVLVHGVCCMFPPAEKCHATNICDITTGGMGGVLISRNNYPPTHATLQTDT